MNIYLCITAIALLLYNALFTVQHQAKELNAAQESKEKQIDTLKRSLQENQAVREADLEKKVW